MSINIYLHLILDKLRLGQRTFLRKYDNKSTHFYVFMVQNRFRNTVTNMNILTNIHSGTKISIHERGALVATFLYCYISILYSISYIPSMHFLPSLALDDDETNILYQTQQKSTYMHFILQCEKCIDKKNWGVMKLLWLNGSNTCYWHCRNEMVWIIASKIWISVVKSNAQKW